MLKKIYHLAAIFAIIHVVAIAALITGLFGTGVLTPERIDEMVAVLRAKVDESQGAEDVVDATETAEAQDAPEAATDVPSDRERQIERLMADRRAAELAQRLNTVLAAQLEVTRQREALKREAEQFEQQMSTRREQEESQGFKKDLDLLSSIKPADALFYMLEKDTAEAAKMLLLMETRKAKRIVEAAKTPAQKQKLAEILAQMHEMSNGESELVKELTGA